MSKKKNKKKVRDAKKVSEQVLQAYKKQEKKFYTKPVPQVPKLLIDKSERDSNVVLMRSIFEVQSNSYETDKMQEFILSYIKGVDDANISVKQDKFGNIYVTKGVADTYPCIVAHTDTVHDIIPDSDYVVLNSNEKFFAIDLDSMDRTGVGGDDKCGIYCGLDNLLREDNIKLAFFVDEEVGCMGSSAADMKFFEDVSFVLQADRKGYADIAKDIMYAPMFGDEFEAKIQPLVDEYKRDYVDGGMTDVLQLTENGLDVAVANFSCGYYEPHTSNEYVVIDELILTSIFFRDIISACYVDGEKNDFVHDDTSSYGRYGYGGYDSYTYSGYGTAVKSDRFSELLDEEDQKYIEGNKSVSDIPLNIHSESCSYCGQPTEWDASLELSFCYNCDDYDYNGR